MSSKVAVTQSRGVRVVGLLSIIAGIVFVIAGGITWWAVADQLSAEDITVSEDASFLAGRHVNDPFSAYAQAEVINKHALEMSDGMTYAELPRDDPRRDVVMNASFLRASLFTSVVSFGVAALVVGLGVLFILVGWALRRLAAAGPQVAGATAGTAGAPGARSYDDLPAAPAPRHQSPAAGTTQTPGTMPGTTSGTTPDASAAAGSATSAAAATAAARPATHAQEPMPPTAPITNPGPEPTVTPTPVPTTPGAPDGVPQENPGNPPQTPQTPETGAGRDERPSGWASPADRVPPVEGTSGETGPTGTR